MTWKSIKNLFSNNRSDKSKNEGESEWGIEELEVNVSTGFGSRYSLNEHTITFDPDTPGSPSKSTGSGTSETGSLAGDTAIGSTSTSDPKTAPTPTPGDVSKGTFAFPNDVDFMQKLEARGLNGAHEPVETIYVLTGPTPTLPTDLIRLDNPEYYASATRRSVRSYGRKMAKKVAALYPNDDTPSLIARFHTHPGGTTTPSSADKNSAAAVRDAFVDAFGTDDFTFFHGIHAYMKHGTNPSPEKRHSPTARSNGVSWRGEQYRHEIALFGPKFQNPRQTKVTDVQQ